MQHYGSKALDASLLMIPLVGFLPASDPRVRGTVEAIERHLVTDGFVARYATTPEVDGLPPGEGAFLPCTFWFADNLELLGRHDDARTALRASAGSAQRRWPPFRGIRPRGETPAGQFPAGVLSRRPGQYGMQAVATCGAGGRSGE